MSNGPWDSSYKSNKLEKAIRDFDPKAHNGKKVFVYYNLHNNHWSIRHNGKVIGHAKNIVIDNPQFKVSEAGRQRVLREKAKNVHAGVVGTINGNESALEHPDKKRVSYNPYKGPTFVVSGTQEPVMAGGKAHMFIEENVNHDGSTVRVPHVFGADLKGLEKAREESGMLPEQKKQFRQERAKFEGNDPLADLETKAGVSSRGIEARRASGTKEYMSVGSPEMHKQRAKDMHVAIINKLKNLKKANDQGRIKQYINESGINKPYVIGSGISSQGYTVRGGMRTISTEGNKGQEFRHENEAGLYDRELARDKAKKVLRDIKSSSKPNLPKSELEKAKIYDFKSGKMIADLGQPEFTTPPRGNLKLVPRDGNAPAASEVAPNAPHPAAANINLPDESPAQKIQFLKARFGGDKDIEAVIDKLQLGHDEPYAHGDIHNIVWRKDQHKSREGKSWNRPMPFPSWNVDPKGVLGKGVAEANGADPFAWMDQRYGATKKVLAEHKNKPLKIHTRSDLIAHDDYINLLNPDLHEINIHLASDNESLNRKLEPGAPSALRRKTAIKKLKDAGFKVNLIHDNISHAFHPEQAQYFNIRHVAKELDVPFKINNIKLSNDTIRQIELVTGMGLKRNPKAAKSELAKGKNAREQRKKIFGTQSRPSGSMREKHMAAIKNFFERRYNVSARPTPGKLNAMGKLIDKPSWTTGYLEYQNNPEAAVHEGGHFEQIPEGVTMEEHQRQMDRNFGIANQKYGYLSGKQTQFEIQPMAAENLLRRRMGLPATKIGHPAKESDPPRTARDTGTPAAVRVKDAKGVVKDLIRQSRLLSPENKERTDMIDRGELQYEKGVGFIPSATPDALINQRAREAAKDPSRKDAKTLMRSEEKGVNQRSIIPKKSTPKMEDKNSSYMGDEVRSSRIAPNAINNAKSVARHVLNQLKNMKKPDLPKSEDLNKISGKQIRAGIASTAIALAPYMKDKAVDFKNHLKARSEARQSSDMENQAIADHFGLKDKTTQKLKTVYGYNSISGKHESHPKMVTETIKAKDQVTNDHKNQFYKDKNIPLLPTILPNNKSELEKANLSLVTSQGAPLGQTKGGKDVFSHGMVGDYQDFSHQDHQDAARLHQLASENANDNKAKQHHFNKAKLHTAAALTAQLKSKRFEKPQQRTTPKSNLNEPKKLFNPDLSGKVDYKNPVKKALLGPRIVSEPFEINRTTLPNPAIISGPNVIQGNDEKDKQVKGNLKDKLKGLKRS